MSEKGTGHFIQQRVTAVANVPLVLFLIWFVVTHLGASRGDVVASVHNPIVAGGLLLSFASIFWHMRLGMQVIIDDYVHEPMNLRWAHIGNTAFVTVLAIAASYAIVKMGLAI